AMANLEVPPTEVKLALEARPLPPQIGHVNFDNDHLFTIRPRFPGELVSFLKVNRDESPYWRDVRFGDRIKQGEVLGVIWSKEVGMAKAELVDATINKKLSEDTLSRHQKAFEEAAISLATLRQTEKQVNSD